MKYLLIPVMVALPVVIVAGMIFFGTIVLHEIRARIDARRKRPKRGLFFTVAFSVYALSLLGWLAGGIAASIVRASPDLHRRLHEEASGSATAIRLSARDYAFDAAQLTVPAGRAVSVQFSNLDRNVEHNVAIYEASGTTLPVPDAEDEINLESSKGYVGHVTREFFLSPIPAGFYTFQCDVFDETVGDHRRYMYGFLTVEPATPVPFDEGFVDTTKRGLATAFHYAQPASGAALDYIFSALAFGLGTYLVLRRRMDRVARLFGVGMIGTAAAYNVQSHATLDVWPALGNAVHPLPVHIIAGIAYVYAVIVFPDGRLVPAFRGRVARAFYASIVFFAIFVAGSGSGLFEPRPGHGHAVAFVTAFAILVPGFGLAAQGYRFVKAETAEARQQSKILLWAFVPAFLLGIAVVIVRTIAGPAGGFSGTTETELEQLAFRIFQPVFIVIPVAIIVGILRYRMWDLDIVINKAILYSTLAGFVAAIYVAVVVGVGRIVDARDNPVLALASTVIVAVAFGPLRQRVQRLADRLVYGRRASPYEALAAFSHSLSATLPAEDVLPRMAEAAARGVAGTGARVTVTLPGGGTRTVAWPEGASIPESAHTVPVIHRSELIGEIGVAKAPGDPIVARDERILSGLAAQTGVALYGVRLTEQLRARLEILSAQEKELALSRHRIVTAAAAERRRLQEEIGDRVENELHAIRAELAKVRRAFARDAGGAGSRLEALAERTNATLDALREIARGVFPPLLADQGVPAALDAQLRKLPMPVSAQYDAAFAKSRFDPESEAALYFCCVEALRLAGGANGGVRPELRITRQDSWVEFRLEDPHRVSDPGVLDEAMLRMTDRVEALGGSVHATVDQGRTVVAGRVPAGPAPQAR